MTAIPPTVRDHHRRVVERLIERFADDARFPALIVGGSVAKEQARDDSDVDVLLVATEEEFARRQRVHDLWYFDQESADYPGGYVDGKVISPRFLAEAEERGSEPMRAAFRGAYVAYSRLPGLPEQIRRIPVYPEHERDEKMLAFYSQVMVLPYFIGEAEKRADPFLFSWAASRIVFFGGRLILAYNRVLFPSEKRLLEEVERAPDKPADFPRLAGALIENPSQETARAVRDCLKDFLGWDVGYGQAISRYFEDSEWNWRSGRPPLQDW